MAETLQIELPSDTINHLAQIARQQQRSVDEVVRELILQELPGLSELPPDVEAELAAFVHLSDDVLQMLATSALSPEQQQSLAALNEAAQQRELSTHEEAMRDALLATYDRTLVRRAEAAAILATRKLSHPPK